MAKTLYIDSSTRDKKVIKLDGFSITTEEDLLTALDTLLKKSKTDLKDISKIKVNRGPGSFTSLRVGVSIANALNYVLGLNELKHLAIPEYGKPPNITTKR